MNESKDHQMKYLEIASVFQNKASEVVLWQRQSGRTCEAVAKRLASERPKTPQEFERAENLKDFVIKTATANEKTIDLLEYIKNLLQDIAKDEEVITRSREMNQLRDQSDTIEVLTAQRDDYFNQIKDEVSRRIKENIK